MLLTQDQLDTFHLDGFVNAGKIYSDAEVDHLREELQLVLNDKNEQSPVLKHNMLQGKESGQAGNPKNLTVHQIVNMWEVSQTFEDHARHAQVTETVARLCNNTDTVRIWHDQIQFKPPKTGGPTGWHQDYPAWPLLVPADLVSAWVALDDADVDNGCMWMVPGSHRWGQMPLSSGPDFELKYDPSKLPLGVEVKTVPMPVKKGEVAFHHCMTWHGSPANQSERPRRAIAVHYMPGYTIYRKTGRHVMEPSVTVAPGEPFGGEHFPVVYERSNRTKCTECETCVTTA